MAKTVKPKTVKKLKGHHVSPRIWGSNITTNPLSQKSVHLELDGENVENAPRMRVANNLTGNKILLTTPKEGEDDGV